MRARARVAVGVARRAVVLPAAAGAAPASLASRLERALRVPHVSSAASAATVDRPRRRAHGRVRAQRDAAAAAGVEREARGHLRRADGARAGVPDRDRRPRRRASRTERPGTGDLVLKGYGDPTLSSAELAVARPAGARDGHHAASPAACVGDETWFDARRTAPGWKAVVLHQRVAAAVGADRRPRPRRPLHVARTRRSRPRSSSARRSSRAGVHVAGDRRARRRRTRRPSRSPPSTRRRSRRSCDWMDRVSDNFTAEMLVKELGAVQAGQRHDRRRRRRRHGPARAGRRADGRRPARRRLGALAARPDDRRRARLAALGDVERPRGAARRCSRRCRSPAAPGRSHDRMRGTAAAGVVRAKTGTTDNASALSGFVGDRYVFSVLQNGWPVSTDLGPTAAGPVRDGR